MERLGQNDDFELMKLVIPGHDWDMHDPFLAFDNTSRPGNLASGSCISAALIACALNPKRAMLIHEIGPITFFDEHTSSEHFLALDPGDCSIIHCPTSGVQITQIEDYRLSSRPRNRYVNETSQMLLRAFATELQNESDTIELGDLAISRTEPTRLVRLNLLHADAILNLVHPGATLEALAQETRERGEKLNNSRDVV